jgi:L-seryl-tRNA(Ser) seleniumtransferase
MSIFETLGVKPVINAKGTATRLSGGHMRPEVIKAMQEASQQCFDMAELQAAASRQIAKVTGAEAGYIASGAAACLLLATAACMARLDPARMGRLPDARGMPHEVIMVRSQRNFYDHAVRAAGASIREVGLPDRHAGAGVRDAESWEIEDAIGDQTAAIFYVAGAQAQPELKQITALARRRKLPVIVDAAAQLPPQSNLKRFIAEGADLVAYSGGKAIGGPQASGFLCGKRDLIMSAALQHLDLDIYPDMWNPPKSLIDKRKLQGMPPHGIGRTCKVGKEEIAGLLTALHLFVAEGDAARHARWLAVLKRIRRDIPQRRDLKVWIENESATGAVPLLVLALDGKPGSASAAIDHMARQKQPVHADPAMRDLNHIIINPLCLKDSEATLVARAAIKGLEAVLG